MSTPVDTQVGEGEREDAAVKIDVVERSNTTVAYLRVKDCCLFVVGRYVRAYLLSSKRQRYLYLYYMKLYLSRGT